MKISKCMFFISICLWNLSVQAEEISVSPGSIIKIDGVTLQYDYTHSDYGQMFSVSPNISSDIQVNWNFNAPVPVTFTGSYSSAWSNAANWDGKLIFLHYAEPAIEFLGAVVVSNGASVSGAVSGLFLK